jgi:hypothetical protein
MHTYFIHSVKLEAVKIGKSVQPLERLKAVKWGNPDDLKILGTIEGNREGEFHQRFAAYRINPRNEWFSLGPELMDFIKAEFHCVLRQKKRPAPKPIEPWDQIADRAEELFGCGLRHRGWEEFYELANDETCGRVWDVWTHVDPDDPDDVPLSEDEAAQRAEEDMEPAYKIFFGLEKWWPWVAGWNVKTRDYLDIFLLFKKPSADRQREELLRDIAHWGDLSEFDGVDFIRLNVAFCWRERLGEDWVGEIRGPVIVDDCYELCFIHRERLIPVGLDEAFDFKILGDAWYVSRGLPVPSVAKKFAEEFCGPPAPIKFHAPFDFLSDSPEEEPESE